MEDCLKEIHEVEETVNNKVRINHERQNISYWANIYLSLLVIVPVIFIFINY